MRTLSICFILLTTFFNQVYSQSDVSLLTPINELGTSEFKGYMGGLYPNGSNSMPAEFYNDAVMFSHSIQPLNADGKVSPDGKIGVVGIGASTVAMFSEGIEKQIYNINGLRKEIVFVNGGIGGQDLNKIYDQQGKYWQVVESRIAGASLTNAQVQVIWIQEDDLKNQTAAFPERANMLVDEFTYAIQQLKIRYPNLKFVYMTGRHTTDYMPADAKDKHQEPRAYINGWACKFIIERQINGDPELAYKGGNVKVPMIIWGPYFWTQGEKPRADGYVFTKNLVSNDGVHPNEAGKLKVANDILNFWKTDAVSQLWFLQNPQDILSIGTMDTTTSVIHTEEKVPTDYLQIRVGNTSMEEIDKSTITGKLRVIILKDTLRIIDEKYAIDDSIQITGLSPDRYKYIVKDEGTVKLAGRFMVDSNFIAIKMSQKQKNKFGTAAALDSTMKNKTISNEQPAWILNGENRLNKLKKLVQGDTHAKVVFANTDGNVVLEIEDFLTKNSNINELVESGKYIVTFYNEEGVKINLQDKFPEYIVVK